MADQDFLHRVAFPTLEDVQVATLAKFSTRRALCGGGGGDGGAVRSRIPGLRLSV
jgi:hypothetical protein